MQRLTQLYGLGRYEALMYWRRRGLLVLLLATLALPLAYAVYMLNQILAAGLTPAAANLTDPAYLTVAVLFATWPPAFIALMLLLPVLVADGLPRDQQLGVRELLDSLPLSSGTYLAGKLLGLWVSLAGGVLIGLAVTSLAWRLVGAYDFGRVAEMWLLGIGGLAWLNGSLGFLLGAGQPNRRRAVLLGSALAAVMVFVLVPGQQAEPGSAWQIWNLARPAFLAGWLEVTGPQPRLYVWQTLAVGAGQVLALAVLIWAWLRRRRA